MDTSAWPEGDFIFFFTVDMSMNGSDDTDQVYHDLVPVVVELIP